MAKGVCCDVQTCLYNHDKKCDAEEILVCQCQCQHANQKYETECHTFKLK